jgi:biotin carboxyl carrier protein
MRRLALAVVGLLALTACSSGSSPSTSVDPLAGVQVPDAFTSVTMRPVSAATFPFLGSDLKYHVAYDLILTDASRVPATIDKVDVVDAAHPDSVVVSYSGAALVDPSCAFGDCNRLRMLPSSPAADTSIPPQESRALLIDFTFDSLDKAPKVVMHHLYGQGTTNPGSRQPSPIDYLAAPLSISSGTPRVIGPPVKGKNWIALNGCCEPGFPHRTSLATFNGMLVNSQRFAIDWKQTDESGAFYQGDKTKNESYVDYGSAVYAVADGTITNTLDTMDANKPGILPANDPVLAPQLTIETVDGNHVVENIGGGVYAFYAHLQKGSLLVKQGDKVKKGQVIAKLGNTGNSNASHMHFHLMDGPSVLGSDGVPYVIDSFSYDGQVAPSAIADADDYLSGTFLSGKLASPQPRTNQLPTQLAIVDFPS